MSETDFIKVLFVEDCAEDIEIVRHELDGLATVDAVLNRTEFMSALENPWDVILADLRLGDLNGEEIIRLSKQSHPLTPVLIVTGSVDEESAALACQTGAVDYVLKSSFVRLRMAVTNAYESAQRLVEIEGRKEQDMRNQRLELLGELSAGMIHDTNNSLACILAGTELLRKRIAPEDEHILDAMLSGAKHGAELTKQMLVFARGSNGSVLKPITAEYLVNEIGQVLRSGAFPNIRSTVTIKPGTGKVLCNPTQVHQILMNLVVNARDALLYGGQIDVTAQTVFLHGNNGPRDLIGDFVKFTVRDNGPGMPPAVQSKIFNAFFSTKPKGKGTGMGLTMCRSIARDHGGDIDVSSSKSGTMFSVYIPTDKPHAEQPVFDGAGKTILLAEDDATMRMFITLHLNGVGYKVLSACNGMEGLALFRSNPDVDILLTDLVMPAMSGPQFLENIQAFGFSVRTIYMTGHDATQAGDPKPDGVLQKPFTREALLTELERVLNLQET